MKKLMIVAVFVGISLAVWFFRNRTTQSTSGSASNPAPASSTGEQTKQDVEKAHAIGEAAIGGDVRFSGSPPTESLKIGVSDPACSGIETKTNNRAIRVVDGKVEN